MFFKNKKRKIINIEGMNDKLDADKIKNSLENLIDISRAKVDLKRKQVIISYDNTVDEIILQDTIEKLGYIVTGIKELS